MLLFLWFTGFYTLLYFFFYSPHPPFSCSRSLASLLELSFVSFSFGVVWNVKWFHFYLFRFSCLLLLACYCYYIITIWLDSRTRLQSIYKYTHAVIYINKFFYYLCVCVKVIFIMNECIRSGAVALVSRRQKAVHRQFVCSYNRTYEQSRPQQNTT